MRVTTATRTDSEKGRAGQQANEGIAELWREAQELNEEYAIAGAEWVPVRAIVIDDSITPRSELNEDAVLAYREVLADLPPITVQRDTFVLIDGRHRLEAHIGVSDHIAVVEHDVSDHELFEAALRSNRAHGVPLTPKERERGGKRLIIERSQMSDGEIADAVGVSPTTVARWRREMVEPEPERPEPGEKPKKIRASLDWMDEAMADFEQGAVQVADEVDPAAVEGHIAQARRFREYVGQVGLWTDAYLGALEARA